MKKVLAPLVFAWLLAGVARAESPVPSLAVARANAAAAVYPKLETQWRNGREAMDELYMWSVRWYQAERDAGGKNAAADHLARMKRLESLVKARAAAGTALKVEELAAAFYRSEAEYWASTP
jgi:hypothetical protein